MPDTVCYNLKKLFVCTTVFFLFGLPAYSQHDVSSEELLSRIASLQVREDGFYFPGMFKLYRSYGPRPRVYKKDNTIFFTTLCLFTLEQLKQKLPLSQQQLIDTIVERGVQPINKYRDRDISYLYNFWRTDTPAVFSNIRWMNILRKRHVFPDDTDDTVMMLMVLQAGDSTAELAHEYMQRFANTRIKRIKNTFKKYNRIPAYSTWLNSRMPVAFEICVLSNVLYFVHQYQLPLRQADSASIDLLKQMIINKDYLKHAAYISPDYNRPAVIIYHLARLLGKFSIPALDSLKPQLINDARDLFHSSGLFLDKVILNTSLIRLGAAPESAEFRGRFSFDAVEKNEFYLFLGDMATYLPNPLRRPIAKRKSGKFYFYCPAYNDVLLLEYLVEQKNYDEQNKKNVSR